MPDEKQPDFVENQSLFIQNLYNKFSYWVLAIFIYGEQAWRSTTSEISFAIIWLFIIQMALLHVVVPILAWLRKNSWSLVPLMLSALISLANFILSISATKVSHD